MTTMQLSIALSLTTILARNPASTWAFVSTPQAISERVWDSALRQHQSATHLSRCSRWGPKPVLASANPNVKDTGSIVADMENWARLISPETHMHRRFEYKVSVGTSLPEVLFDFWKCVSEVIDAHRSTKAEHSLRKLIMFVAPFCEELNDYETMEHTHQLLQQSARDGYGGCSDFGKEITHTHFHPNFRFRPRPKETRMASRHSPYPAFSLDVLYRTGGLKSLQSMRTAAEEVTAKSSAGKARQTDPSKRRGAQAQTKRDEWAASARSRLESLYNKPACYGAEDTVEASEWELPWDSNAPSQVRGVPESSQEIMQATQAWLKSVLKDAAECDSEANNTKHQQQQQQQQQATFPTLSKTTAATVVDGGRDVTLMAGDRSTAFMPPTTAEVSAALAATQTGEKEATGHRGGGGVEANTAVDGVGLGEIESLDQAAFAALQEAMAVTADSESEGQPEERDVLYEWDVDENDDSVLLPGKELVKRMSNIAQYIVTRSKTAEEAYGDVWEVVVEMAGRAATRGCSVPTEDYSSSSLPCYSAVMVTPDLATYNAESFHRFQEILNRGLKHLPMEHDISVEAFHPETVSEASSLDHHFMRSPYPTLHICYHGLRERGTALHPAVNRKHRDESSTKRTRKLAKSRLRGTESRSGSGRSTTGVARRAVVQAGSGPSSKAADGSAGEAARTSVRGSADENEATASSSSSSPSPSASASALPRPSSKQAEESE